MQTLVMLWAASNRSGIVFGSNVAVARLIIAADGRIVDSLGFGLSKSVG
jgi:hypothetical protein